MSPDHRHSPALPAAAEKEPLLRTLPLIDPESSPE